MPDSVENYVACRICMDSKDRYVSLFTQDLSMKVMEVADVQVEENDGLPASICTDCEQDLEKCYEFRLKVQLSDRKFRENINLSQVEIEECSIKEERIADERNSDHADENNSYSMDEHHDDETEITQEMAPGEIGVDLMSQQEDINEEPPLQRIEEVALDPLVCMKEETETDIMDVDIRQPDPFGPSSSVRRGGSSKTKRNLAEAPDRTIGTDSFNDGMAVNPKVKEMPQTSGSTTHFLILNNNENTQKPSRKLKTKIKRLLSKQSRTKTQKHEVEYMSDSMSQDDNSKKMESDSISYDSDSQSSSASPKKSNSFSEEQMKKREPFCPVCNVSYETNELLNEHRGKRGFICRVCAALFDSHADLEAHFTSHQSYNCKVCGEIFFCKIDLYQHKKTSEPCNKQVLFECEMCNKKFSRERNLRSHKSVYHSENVEHFECVVCKKTFKTSFLLTNHLRHSHVVFEYMECSICHTLCLGPERLKTHFKSHNEESQFPCPDCGEIFNKKSLLRSHMPSHDFSINLCEICGESIRGKVAMKNHVDYKHQTGTFFCNLCNMKFDTKRKMVIHRKSHNRRYLPKPSICEICGKEFTSTQVLKNHLRIHFDERPFKCDICGASFKQKVSLRNHHRTHSDVGQYCCISCGKSFKWKQTYDKHVKNCKFKFECIPGSTSE